MYALILLNVCVSVIVCGVCVCVCVCIHISISTEQRKDLIVETWFSLAE